jgi:DMSO/TMAO reductase YedYZ molybdopterin-dependent catalytic subunit
MAAHEAPPTVPDDPTIEIGGDVANELEVGVADLSAMTRRQVTADFHCVAGWTAKDQSWEGVPFVDFYREVIEDKAHPSDGVRYVAFVGLDGFRSVLLLEDALGGDVLLADRWDGAALNGDHGAPVRLLSPGQYGYKNTKHVCRIEVHKEPPLDGHEDRLNRFLLGFVKTHPRARVAHEERNGYLPPSAVRGVYRNVILPALLLRIRASRRDSNDEI